MNGRCLLMVSLLPKIHKIKELPYSCNGSFKMVSFVVLQPTLESLRLIASQSSCIGREENNQTVFATCKTTTP